jgi:hypothetical protein
MSVQGCPVEYTTQSSIRSTMMPSMELSGTTERLLASYSLPYPAEQSANHHSSSKASERQKKKISWLSKFAGWSGHAALISNCPEFFAAGPMPA